MGVGRSGRLRRRAQNRVMVIESAPRSSKKLLSTGTWSDRKSAACGTTLAHSAGGAGANDAGGGAGSVAGPASAAEDGRGAEAGAARDCGWSVEARGGMLGMR